MLQPSNLESMTGVEGIKKAAIIYVEAMKKDQSEAEKIQKAAKFLPTSIFQKLEKVGKDVMDWRLLTDVRHKARIKALSRDIQERILNGDKFHFLTSDGSHLMIPLVNCDISIARQMFNHDHIRSLAEQKVYLDQERKRIKDAESSNTLDYEVNEKKKTITFNAARQFTFEQLRLLVLQLPYK